MEHAVRLRMALALALALTLGGCGLITDAPARPEALAVQAEVGGGERSWSWSLLPGMREADPLLVGLDRRSGGPATLQVVLVHAGGYLERRTNLPTIEGALHSVTPVRHSLGVTIVGARVDDAGVPHVFVLTSEDGQAWSEVPLKEDLGFVPAAVAADGRATFVGRDRLLWRIGTDGTATRLSPPLTDGERIVRVAALQDVVSLLARDAESGEVRLSQSSDRGATWTVPVPLLADSGETIEPTGLTASGRTTYVTGSCGEEGKVRHACLLVGAADTWRTELPFGENAISTRLVQPAITDDGSLVTAATTDHFSEGWLARRTPAGAWQGSRADVVGNKVGEVASVGAGPAGAGFVAVVADMEATRVVLRSDLSAAPAQDVSILLGGPGLGSWIRSSGSSLGARSQFLLVKPTTVPSGQGGAYFVTKKVLPVTVSDDGLVSAEWRPAFSRSMDAPLAERHEGTTVFVSSEAVRSLEDVGTMHVYASDSDGTWAEVGQGLAPRFKNQMAQALTAADGRWVLASANPMRSAGSDDPARFFTSSDGRSWEEVPGPRANGLSVTDLCAAGPDTLLAIGADGALARPAAWIRRGSTWSTLALPPGLEPIACAAQGSHVVVVLTGTGGASVWRLDGDQLQAVDAALPVDTEITSAVPLDGGLALAGATSWQGLSVPTVWFSPDAVVWQAVPLGDGAGGGGFVTMMGRGEDLVVVSSSQDGVHAWQVAAPW